MTYVLKENVYSQILIPAIHIKPIRSFPANGIFRGGYYRILIVLKQAQCFFHCTFQLWIMAINHLFGCLHNMNIGLDAFAFYIPLAVEIIESATRSHKITP